MDVKDKVELKISVDENVRDTVLGAIFLIAATIIIVVILVL